MSGWDSLLGRPQATSTGTPVAASGRRPKTPDPNKTPPASLNNAAKTPLSATSTTSTGSRYGSIRTAGHGLHGQLKCLIFEAKDLDPKCRSAVVSVELGSLEASTPPADVIDGTCTWDQEHIFIVDQRTESLIIVTVADEETGQPLGHAKLGFAKMAKRDVKDCVSAEVDAWLPLALTETKLTGSIHMSFCFTHFLDSNMKDPDAGSAPSGPAAPQAPRAAKSGPYMGPYEIYSSGIETMEVLSDPRTPAVRPRSNSFRRTNTHTIERDEAAAPAAPTRIQRAVPEEAELPPFPAISPGNGYRRGSASSGSAGGSTRAITRAAPTPPAPAPAPPPPSGGLFSCCLPWLAPKPPKASSQHPREFRSPSKDDRRRPSVDGMGSRRLST
eukprot:tig00022075_g23577.t1